MIPVITIDDYGRAKLGDCVQDFRGTLVGRGFIDLLPWIPVNNIQGLNTPKHVDSVQTEMHGLKLKPRWERDIRAKKALYYKYITHAQSKRDIHIKSVTP